MPRFTKTCHVSPTSWRRATRARVSSRSSVSALVAGEWRFCEKLFCFSFMYLMFIVVSRYYAVCQRLHNFKLDTRIFWVIILSAFVSYLPPHDMSYAISSCVCAFFSIQTVGSFPYFEMAPSKLRCLLTRNISYGRLFYGHSHHTCM